jgi:hypothetical protein
MMSHKNVYPFSQKKKKKHVSSLNLIRKANFHPRTYICLFALFIWCHQMSYAHKLNISMKCFKCF